MRRNADPARLRIFLLPCIVPARGRVIPETGPPFHQRMVGRQGSKLTNDWVSFNPSSSLAPSEHAPEQHSGTPRRSFRS
jgi:hypothetical protein